MLEGAFEVIMFHFVEAIHVELPHKAVHFFVSEVSRQHYFLEFDYILDHELLTIVGPVDNLLVFLDLNRRRTTDSISNVL